MSELETFSAREPSKIHQYSQFDPLYLEPYNDQEDDGTLQLSENGTISDTDLRIVEAPSRKVTSKPIEYIVSDCTFQQKDLVDIIKVDKDFQIARVEEVIFMGDREGNQISEIQEVEGQTDEEYDHQVEEKEVEPRQIIELKPISLLEETIKVPPKRVLVPKVFASRKPTTHLNKSYEQIQKQKKVFEMSLVQKNEKIKFSPRRRNKRTLSANIIPHKSPSSNQPSFKQINLKSYVTSQNNTNLNQQDESTNRVMYRDNSSTNTTNKQVQRQLRIKVLSSTKSSNQRGYAKVSPIPFFRNKEELTIDIASQSNTLNNSRNNSYRAPLQSQKVNTNQILVQTEASDENKCFINFHNQSFQIIQPPMILPKYQTIQQEQEQEQNIRSRLSTERSESKIEFKKKLESKENLNLTNQSSIQNIQNITQIQKKNMSDLYRETIGLMNEIKNKQHSKFINHIRQRNQSSKTTIKKDNSLRIEQEHRRVVSIMEQKHKVDSQIDRILNLIQSKLQ